MAVSKRLIIIPRWSGRPNSDWYPWLRRSLEQHASHAFEPVVAAAMPHPEQPTIAAWVAKIAELVGPDPVDIARTVLVGHSIGCQAILHYLATLPTDVSLHGLLSVAGWWWVDHPWDSLQPWIKTPVDLKRVRTASDKCVVLISDNDPFIADWVANKRAWGDRLNAMVFVVPGAEHFNAPQQPVVLQTLIEQFA